MDTKQTQLIMNNWISREFSSAISHTHGERERSMRVLEEAIALCQACGITAPDMQVIIKRCMNRPVGDVRTEVQQVGITFLAFCASKCYSADELITIELLKILNRPQCYFTRRMREKVLAMPSLYSMREVNAAKQYLEAEQK